MKKKIGIINYGAGNIFSVRSSIEILGGSCLILNSPEEIQKIDALILPGVGDYKYASSNLKQAGFFDAINIFAKSGKLVMGICLGMQLLMDKGNENGESNGIGLFRGQAVPLNNSVDHAKVPRIGWHAIQVVDTANSIFDLQGKHMYFAHSYYVESEMRFEDELRSMHGSTSILAGFSHQNIIGTQFHPEKSGKTGLDLLNKILFS